MITGVRGMQAQHVIHVKAIGLIDLNDRDNRPGNVFNFLPLETGRDFYLADCCCFGAVYYLTSSNIQWP